jgi:CRP/FNR family transcriptional regulator
MSRAGKVLNLKLAVPGDVLGLSAVLSGAEYEVSAETIETSALKSIARDQFLGFLNSNAEGGVLVAQRIAEDYRLALQDACRLALSGSVVSRIAGILLDWGRAASNGKTEMRFNMAVSHTELASFAGTSRETVSRTLGKLRKNRTISIHGANICILLPDTLAKLAS